MARGIKWRLQFKSLSGVGCLVNIYQNNYTSSADTTKTGADVPFNVETGVKDLVGAAVPFEYQEEDSTDLLDIIRYRTGYIRVIEEEFDELADLIPTTLTAHYVEAFYGTELVFTGFMQMQTFQQPWTAVPRQLEFPIISPLGLLSSFEFSAEEPTTTTVGTLLKSVADGLNAGYTHVAYPYDSSNQVYPWGEAISGTVTSPLNADFKRYNTADDLYVPNTYEYFLHGLCATMGWILHDWPGRLFFASPDCAGCSLLPLSSAALGTNSGISLITGGDGILSFFTEADNDSTISTIVPLKSLELNVDGEGKTTHSLPTEYGYRNNADLLSYFHQSSKWGFGGSLRIAGTIVQSGITLGMATWGTQGSIYKQAGAIASLVIYAVDDDTNLTLSPNTFWIVYPGSLSSSNTMLLGFRSYGIYENGKYVFKLVLEKGTDMKDLQANGWSDDIILQLVIRNLTNNKYLNISSDQWGSSITYNTITVSKTTGKVESNATSGDWAAYSDIDGILFNLPLGIKDIEVSVYANNQSHISSDDIIKFASMSFSRVSSWSDNELDWSEEFKEKIHVLHGTDKGVDDGSLTMEINDVLYFDSSHSFAGGTDIADKYAHVFTPYTFLKEVFRRANNGSTFAWYAKGHSYWRQGWGWHLLAHSFNMRDDEVELTLMTPNVSSEFTQMYNVDKLLMGVSVNTPARVAEHSSVEWTLMPESGFAIDYVQVKMGGTDITSSAYNSGTQKITIADVTGDIVITATAAAETFSVTTDLTNCSLSGAATATGGSEYHATITPDSHATITSVEIEMAGVDVSQYYINGAISIPYVTGDIVITAVAEASEYSVTAYLTHIHVQMYYPYVQDLPSYIEKNTRLSLKLIEDSGYRLSTVQVLMSGVDITNQVRYSDAISIEHVTGPVVITAVGVESVTLPVTCTFDGVTSDAPASVQQGDSLTVELSGTSGKQVLPGFVKVTMGGVDITPTAYDHNTNTISIASVTGAVAITAEGATVSSSYKPLDYIATQSKTANGIALDYKPNSSTKLVIDAELVLDSLQLLYGIISPNTEASGSTPQFYFWVRINQTYQWAMAWGAAEQKRNSASANGLIKTGERTVFTCDCGTHSYINQDGNAYSQTLAGGTWTTDKNLVIFNWNGTGNTYATQGKIYRTTISESGTIKKDYVPVRRISDNAVGLYDIITGDFITATNYAR